MNDYQRNSTSIDSQKISCSLKRIEENMLGPWTFVIISLTAVAAIYSAYNAREAKREINSLKGHLESVVQQENYELERQMIFPDTNDNYRD